MNVAVNTAHGNRLNWIAMTFPYRTITTPVSSSANPPEISQKDKSFSTSTPTVRKNNLMLNSLVDNFEMAEYFRFVALLPP